jgi:ribonuclease R
MSHYLPPAISKDTLSAFINESDKPVTKGDIANYFGIKGQARIYMKRALKELISEGRIEQTASKTYRAVDQNEVPSIVALRIGEEEDFDGALMAFPTEEDAQAPWAQNIRVEVNPDPNKSKQAPAAGDKILARLHFVHDNLFYADVIKLLAKPKKSMIGRLRRAEDGWIVQPVNKRERNDFVLELPPKDSEEAKALETEKLDQGTLVDIEPLPHKGRGAFMARLKSIIGHDNDPRAISLIAIHEYDLPHEFPDEVLEDAYGLKVPPLKAREDLRDIPLVTIDGADARDFDDAVFAQKDKDPKNKGGYHLIVAIADVAHYVKKGTALDREALKRGNSTYFPDRVVPMLPEALSNDLCSLRPHEDRACMAMHMWIDAQGKLIRYKPVRGLMRSAARLIYEQVQAAKDGVTDEVTAPLMKDVIEPLYAVFDILADARARRGALDIEMPERQILIDDNGNMTGVKKRNRVDAHKLIEEFMILANVAAARALEDKDAPCIYRVHGRPSEERLDSARVFVESLGLGLKIPKGGVIKPANLNRLLHKVRDTDNAHIVNEVILRSQAQAVYHPDNEGHFGLGLEKYAHFTSPIRRYADLIVHRSLIKAYKLGDGGLNDEEAVTLESIAERISKTERTSMEAERAATDRFTASWMAQHTGQSFDGRISGVSRFGLFVRLEENGAEGIIPMRSLKGDFFVHDEKHHALVGRRTGLVYRLCAPVRVEILEADRLTGAARFELLNPEKGAEVPGFVTPKTQFKPSGKSYKPRGKKPPRSGGKSSDKSADFTKGKKKKRTTPKHKRK